MQDMHSICPLSRSRWQRRGRRGWRGGRWLQPCGAACSRGHGSQLVSVLCAVPLTPPLVMPCSSTVQGAGVTDRRVQVYKAPKSTRLRGSADLGICPLPCLGTPFRPTSLQRYWPS